MSSLAFILGVILAAKSSDASCPNHYTPGPDSGMCNYYGNINVTDWYSAWVKCKEKSGYLVGINTVDEYNDIKAKIQEIANAGSSIDGYWTGGRYHSGEWVWQRNENNETFYDPLDVQYWATGHPTNDPGLPKADIRMDFKLYSDKYDFVPRNGMSYICETAEVLI